MFVNLIVLIAFFVNSCHTANLAGRLEGAEILSLQSCTKRNAQSESYEV